MNRRKLVDVNLTLISCMFPIAVSAYEPSLQEAELAGSAKTTDIIGVSRETHELYSASGMLVMFTVPNLKQHEIQKRWYKQILKVGWPESGAPRCVVVEDLSQQETYREKALAMIEEKARQDPRLTFVIDPTGELRKMVNSDLNETVVLIVDKRGKVIHREHNEVEPDAESARRIVKVVRQMIANQKGP